MQHKDVQSVVMSKKVMKRLLCREIGSMVQSIMSISVISVAIIMIEMKMQY